MRCFLVVWYGVGVYVVYTISPSLRSLHTPRCAETSASSSSTSTLLGASSSSSTVGSLSTYLLHILCRRWGRSLRLCSACECLSSSKLFNPMKPSERGSSLTGGCICVAAGAAVFRHGEEEVLIEAEGGGGGGSNEGSKCPASVASCSSWRSALVPAALLSRLAT